MAACKLRTKTAAGPQHRCHRRAPVLGDLIKVPKFLFVIAILFALVAIAVCAIFLRPVPIRTGFGKITNKTFKPAGTYWQYPAGIDRGFHTATPIPLAEAYVFQIALDRYDRPVFFSLNTVASRNFDVGQTVQINYQERSLPFSGTRLYILNMESR